MIPVPVQDAIEAIHGGDWCVAGGFAACPALAEDVDVWLFGIQNDEDNEHARVSGLLSERLRHYYGDQFEDGPRTTSYIGTNYTVTRVGYVNQGDEGLRIHLMIVDAPDVQSLVDAFDISTHAVAIDSEGIVVKAKCWTPITRPPVKLKDTSTTNDRMEKISNRYGFCWDAVAEEATRG